MKLHEPEEKAEPKRTILTLRGTEDLRRKIRSAAKILGESQNRFVENLLHKVTNAIIMAETLNGEESAANYAINITFPNRESSEA